MMIDVVKLAREAGFELKDEMLRAPGCWYSCDDELRHFAALIVEECAKAVQETEWEHEPSSIADAKDDIAAAIRQLVKESK